MRTLREDIKTPLQYMDRVWLRRTILTAAAVFILFFYLGEAIIKFGQNFIEIWTIE